MDLTATITRLNELYHKSQQSPLTQAELAERDKLRRCYLDAIRGQIKATLDNVKVSGAEESKTGQSCGHEGCDCCSHKH